MNDENEVFKFCQKVDLYALDLNCDIKSIVAVALEHGFRGIVIPPCKLHQLKKEIGNNKLLSILAVDYPFGCLSQDVRCYSIYSAKEKGADEVELVSPYHCLNNVNMASFNQDVINCMTAGEKINIPIRYVFDQNIIHLKDNIKQRALKTFLTYKVRDICTSLGFFDNKIDHSENILKLRNIKVKTGCKIKIFIKTNDVNIFALYPKAGVDLLGLEWENAANLVHAYENMVAEHN